MGDPDRFSSSAVNSSGGSIESESHGRGHAFRLQPPLGRKATPPTRRLRSNGCFPNIQTANGSDQNSTGNALVRPAIPENEERRLVLFVERPLSAISPLPPDTSNECQGNTTEVTTADRSKHLNYIRCRRQEKTAAANEATLFRGSLPLSRALFDVQTPTMLCHETEWLSLESLS